jgi:serine/threonine protein kinase
MTDLITIARRLEAVDKAGEFFPKMIDFFFHMVGYTVETLLVGCNCLEKRRAEPMFFRNFANLQVVARGEVHGLMLMSKAGVVHCDVKPDNIMWLAGDGKQPMVRLVDFGCARLDRRVENGRNWALAENGAGHLGKWTPEMMLRLAITDKTDVWGLAVSLLELHSARALWNCEADTAAIVLAQALGLVNARDGLPESLLRRSPLDIRQLYTPSPAHFPIMRVGHGFNSRYKELRPATWGLGCVLGDEAKWNGTQRDFAAYVLESMTLDHEQRPPAAQMMSHSFVVNSLSV